MFDTENRSENAASALDLGALRRVGAYVTASVRLAVLGTLVAGWTLFWGLLVRLHVVLGNPVEAALVGAVFVVPAVVGFLWYAAATAGVVETATATP